MVGEGFLIVGGGGRGCRWQRYISHRADFEMHSRIDLKFLALGIPVNNHTVHKIETVFVLSCNFFG
jgi:hypothetical protein